MVGEEMLNSREAIFALNFRAKQTARIKHWSSYHKGEDRCWKHMSTFCDF